MTGPGGERTKRDERRDSRRAQYQQQQRERQLKRQQELRRQQITRIAITVGGVILTALLLFLIIHAVTGSSAGAKATPTQHAQYTTPALGETREGLSCFGPTVSIEQHIHAYLAYYVNGKQVDITPNTGVLSNCVYPVHEHVQNPNILHVEAPNQDTYVLGDFFAVWGQHLSATQVGSNVADATHTLVYETIDENGTVTKWPSTQDPWNIPLTAHETIVILYNSPDIKPAAYTQWGGL